MATEQLEPVAPPSGEPPVPGRGTGAAGVPALRRRRTDHVQSGAPVIIAVAVVLALCYVAKLVLVVLLVSILVAFMLEPLVMLLERLRLPRALAALISLLVLAAVLFGLSTVFYNNAQDFVQSLPRYSQRIKAALEKFREKAERVQKTTQTVLPEATTEEKQAVKVQQQTAWTDYIISGLGSVGEVALAVSFVPFLVFFMLTWQDHTRAATVMLFDMENRNTAYVTLGRISAMIRSFILGNLIVGVFLSIASTVVFGILGLPYFYFLGLLSGFLSLVPYLGVVLAMVPPIMAGFGQLNGAGFLTIIITVLALHLFAINVLYPKLIGRRLQLNPLAVTIALLFWGWLWGAMGLILAVPITAALKIIFDHIEKLRPYGAWLGE
ncbi:MAG TPA: AI-2E family transporter [Terriglobales bacterium]|nr:AI-2E family transporter [Terriglobales bacterium]